MRLYCRCEPPSPSCHFEHLKGTRQSHWLHEIASSLRSSQRQREKDCFGTVVPRNRYAPRNDRGEKVASALLCLVMTERGTAFSGQEDSHSKLVGAGFSGTGCMGDEAVRQRYRAHLRVKLHISLSYYPRYSRLFNPAPSNRNSNCELAQIS
jgi:hypothetical protein